MKISKKNRLLVRERAKECCEYCLSQLRVSPGPFSVEHIISKAKGGSSLLANLAFSCEGCNSIKSTYITGYDPVTGLETRLYNPRTDKWEEHFSWHNNFEHIIGHTPIGRSTVSRLQLNRSGLVELRRIMVLVGLHPPE